MRIRVLLADPHTLLRHGMAAILAQEPDLKVVGEVEDGLQAVQQTHLLQPDVVLMNVSLPVLSSVEAARRIRAVRPEVRVLIISGCEDDRHVSALLRAGASGYLLKTARGSELVAAIRQVRAVGLGPDPAGPRPATRPLANRPPHQPRPHQTTAAPASAPLTPRQLEVLRLLAQGSSNRSIARTLAISDRTVQTHLTHIFSKMQVTSRMEALLEAVRRGWLSAA